MQKHMDTFDEMLIIWNAREGNYGHKALSYAEKRKIFPQLIMLPALTAREYRKYIDCYIEFGTSVEARRRKDLVWDKLMEKIGQAD